MPGGCSGAPHSTVTRYRGAEGPAGCPRTRRPTLRSRSSSSSRSSSRDTPGCHTGCWASREGCRRWGRLGGCRAGGSWSRGRGCCRGCRGGGCRAGLWRKSRYCSWRKCDPRLGTLQPTSAAQSSLRPSRGKARRCPASP